MLVCPYVCLFSIEIQTAGWIWTKFGTEVVLEGGRFLGGGGGQHDTPTPGYEVHKGGMVCSVASAVCFDKNSIK